MAQKILLLDMEAAAAMSGEPIRCAYYYHPGNDGLGDLRETATFALLCRRCEDKPCVTVCVHEALEKQTDGTVQRHNLRCVGCESCVAACPFGVISPAIVRYINDTCDRCVERGDEAPPCVANAPRGVLRWLDADDPTLRDEDVQMISDRVAIRCRRWERTTQSDQPKPVG